MKLLSFISVLMQYNLTRLLGPFSPMVEIKYTDVPNFCNINPIKDGCYKAPLEFL